MNGNAQELNLASNYANPHGLMHRENKSSAVDVAKLSCKALENSIFREVKYINFIFIFLINLININPM